MSTQATGQGLTVAVTNDNTMSFDLLLRQADVLATSRIIPRAYQNRSADVIAAGLAGFAFGWDVMTSLRNYHVIEGTASLRPEAMLGLVRRAGHSVTLVVIDSTVDGQSCRMARATGVRRDNNDQHVAELTTLDAKKAGLANKNNWKQYEDSMLTWRAVSALCRVLFPDVVLGAGYVPEELGAIVSDIGEIVEEDPFAVATLTAGQAKTQLLEACDGDKELAKTVWADRGSVSMTQDALDALIAQVRNKIGEVEDDIEEAVVIETIATDSDLERRIAFFSETTTTTGEDQDDSAN